MSAVRTIICVGGIKMREIEDADIEGGRGQPLVPTWYRENAESFPVSLRSFDDVILRIAERERVRYFQVSLHAGNVYLETRAVPLTSFDLN